MTKEEQRLLTENEFERALKLLIIHPERGKWSSKYENPNFETGVSDEAVQFCLANYDGHICTYHAFQIAMMYFANHDIEKTCETLNLSSHNFKVQMNKFIDGMREAYKFYQSYGLSKHIPIHKIDKKLDTYLRVLDKIRNGNDSGSDGYVDIPFYLDTAIENVFNPEADDLGFMNEDIYHYRNGVLILTSLNHDLGRWNRLKYYIGKDHPFFDLVDKLYRERPYNKKGYNLV